MSIETEELAQAERAEKRLSIFSWPALIFAVLQSICTALIAASGMQFAVGLAGLITAIVTSTAAQRFHMDAIRLPMLLFALASAAINLAIVFQTRRLRRRPSSQWRVQPPSKAKRGMERRQLALSFFTLLFVFLELMAHKSLHGTFLIWLGRFLA